VVLQLDDRPEGDELGPVVDLDLRNHPAVVSGFVAPEIEWEEPFIRFGNL